MKKILLTLGLVGTLALNAAATTVNWYSGLGNTTLADNSAAGSAFSTAASGTWNGTWSSGQVIENINLYLNISGGYNGDLYGYLIYNDGTTTRTELLLNRIGGGNSAASGSGFGSGTDAGSFANLSTTHGVRLSDSGGSAIGSAAPGAGTAVTAGNYTPDSGTTFASTFNNLNSGGTWTLFLADLATGDQSTLVSWGLQIDVVPEPATWALIIFGAVMGGTVVVRRMRRATA